MTTLPAHDVANLIGHFCIVPVVTVEHVEDAVPLAHALQAGGLPVMEIALRTPAALQTITAVAKSGSDILLGAGTVLTTEQVKSAFDAGARFVVSPGLNRKVVEYCLSQGIAVYPGVLTPTEISTALDMGLDLLKFFPAQAVGGVNYLKAVIAPFPKARFIPTGGIDESNIVPYFQVPAVWAVGGSWMVKKDLITQKRFSEITKLTAEGRKLISGMKRPSRSAGS